MQLGASGQVLHRQVACRIRFFQKEMLAFNNIDKIHRFYQMASRIYS